MLNDVVTRRAFARQIDLIDLRTICDADVDFANAIEPSVRGGAKIVRAILDFALLPGIAMSRVCEDEPVTSARQREERARRPARELRGERHRGHIGVPSCASAAVPKLATFWARAAFLPGHG